MPEVPYSSGVWLTRMLRRHHEAAKFLVVGGVCFLTTAAVNYWLKLTVLPAKPVTALVLATLIATIMSYVLNREWAFRTRGGGRERHHEATLFFVVSAIAVALNSVPLAISRYIFHLRVPDVSRPVQEIADFVSGMIIGTVIAMVFRLWAFKRVVFTAAPAPSRPVRKRGTKGGPRSGVTRHQRPAARRAAAVSGRARPRR
jgi:putative flippase GtrA